MERFLELSGLALAASRLIGVAAMPAARREWRAHPPLVTTATLAALAAVGVIAWAAVATTPWALRSIAALVLTAWAALTWRTRPSYGQRRGLPPGSLGLRPSLRAIIEPSFYAEAVSRHGPIFKMAQFHRPVACVLGLERGAEILRLHGDALRPPPLPLSAKVPRGFLRYMAPADHTRYSRLFRAAVSEATLRAVEPFARATTGAALAAFATKSQRVPGTGAHPRAAIENYLLTILLRLYFGGLLHAQDTATIAAYLCDADLASATGAAAPRAVRALRGFEALIATRTAADEAGNDATDDPSIWGGLLRLEPGAASDATVIGNLFLLLGASQSSIGGVLTWLIALLSRVPAWRDLARSTPIAGGDDPAARAVLETLRLAQSEYVYREVMRPIAFDGFVVPHGWLLRICVAESHRQASIFDEPDRFDPDRHRDRHYAAHELAPFGLDLHACLGARMTLLLGRILARELIDAYEWDVSSDGPPERGNRHWHHWQPSARFRIVLRHRSTPAA